MTSNVSTTGAFVKACEVAATGERIVLHERGPDAHEPPVRLVCEVRWGIPEPTLDRPETGFGVEFLEVWVPGTEEAPLERFLGRLVPEVTPEPRYERRGEDEAVVHVFAAGEREATPSTKGEQPDLAASPAVGPSAAAAEPTPANAPSATTPHAPGEETAYVSWPEGGTRVTVVAASRRLMVLQTHGHCPAAEHRVAIAPAPRADPDAGLRIHGTVTRVTAHRPDRGRRFTVRIEEVDEPAAQGHFETYLQRVAQHGGES